MYEDRYNKIEEDKVAYQNRYYAEKQKPNNLFIPTESELVSTWLQREGSAVFQSRETNIASHINNGKRVWWTHRSSGPCFMCDDLVHIKILYECLTALSEHTDFNKFKWTKLTDDTIDENLHHQPMEKRTYWSIIPA